MSIKSTVDFKVILDGTRHAVSASVNEQLSKVLAKHRDVMHAGTDNITDVRTRRARDRPGRGEERVRGVNRRGDGQDRRAVQRAFRRREVEIGESAEGERVVRGDDVRGERDEQDHEDLK